MKMFVNAEILGEWILLWKTGEVKGNGVNSGYKIKALITWAGLARLAEISAPYINATKISFAITWHTEPARLAGITVMLGPRLEMLQVITLVGSPANQNQATNRTGCNTLLMCIASSLYIKIAASRGLPGSCNTRIKVISVEPASTAYIIRPLLWIVLSRSLHLKALEFAAFVVRVWENTT